MGCWFVNDIIIKKVSILPPPLAIACAEAFVRRRSMLCHFCGQLLVPLAFGCLFQNWSDWPDCPASGSVVGSRCSVGAIMLAASLAPGGIRGSSREGISEKLLCFVCYFEQCHFLVHCGIILVIFWYNLCPKSIVLLSLDLSAQCFDKD